VGFWTFAIVFMWAITGAYLVFPMPFEKALAVITGDHLNIHWTLHALHVGNFAGLPVKVLWAVLGLAPPLLFVTGVIMWWHRVLGPWLARNPRAKPGKARGVAGTYHRPHHAARPRKHIGYRQIIDPACFTRASKTAYQGRGVYWLAA
jgi:hypothetical protein